MLIADDVASNQGTFCNPVELIDLLGPHYEEIISLIHSYNAKTLFHSCGNITDLVPFLFSIGFYGLAACQGRIMDLVSIKQKYPKLTYFTGIDEVILESKEITDWNLEEYKNQLRKLAEGSGIVLSSSTGLYSTDSVERLRRLYAIAETIKRDLGLNQ